MNTVKTLVLSNSGKQIKLSERIGVKVKYVKFVTKDEILELQVQNNLGEIKLVDLRA